LKHDVAHEFGLNHHKFLSSWLESLTSLRNPQVMPNKWLTNFTFREESLYAQLCCIAYWLNAIATKTHYFTKNKVLKRTILHYYAILNALQ